MLMTFPTVFTYTEQIVEGWSTRHRLCVKQQKYSELFGGKIMTYFPSTLKLKENIKQHES
jgi:hypothetical protein